MSGFARFRKKPNSNHDGAAPPPVATPPTPGGFGADGDFGFMGSSFGGGSSSTTTGGGGLFGEGGGGFGGFGEDTSHNNDDSNIFSFHNNSGQPPPASSPGAGLSMFQSRCKKQPPSTPNEPQVQTPSSSTTGPTPSTTNASTLTSTPQDDRNWGVSANAGKNDPQANHHGAFCAESNNRSGSGSKNSSFESIPIDPQPMMGDAAPSSGLFQNRSRDASLQSPEDGNNTKATQKQHVTTVTPKEKTTADETAWSSPFSQVEQQPENSPQGLFPSKLCATPTYPQKNRNESFHLTTPATTAIGGATANLVSPMPDQILPLNPSPVATMANPHDPMGPPPPRPPVTAAVAAATQEPFSFQQPNDVVPADDSPQLVESFQSMHTEFEQYLRNTDDKQQSFAETLLDATVEVDMVTAEWLECYSAAIHFSYDLESIQAELADKIRVLKMCHNPEEIDLTNETDDAADYNAVDE